MAALAGAATADEPSVKAMNNYLGIGIDAKVTAKRITATISGLLHTL